MAIDVYLQIKGIKGESTDQGHKGWSECQSVHWAMSQPKSATCSTAGGHSAERCDMTDISLIKLADLSSPLLAQNCATGRTLPKAKFEFLRADGAGTRVLYFEIELTSVMIGHLAPGIEAGSILTEMVGLKFAKVVWKYTQQKVGGGSGGNTPKPEGAGAPNEEVFSDLRPTKEGNWMACYYGPGLDFILSRRLPETVTECRIAYSTDANKQYKVGIRCR